jgi:DHA2 family multidrug resistance protein
MSAAALTRYRIDAGKPAVNPWGIAFALSLATFIEVLDNSIANVALPRIAGSLSAGTSPAT